MILYFTGTGNSQLAAQIVGEIVKDDLFSINASLKASGEESLYSESPWVFVVPTYGWQMPRVVEAWIRGSLFNGSNDVYFILTCGGGTGNGEKYAAKLCREKGWELKGFHTAIMPENYIAMFPVPDKGKAQETIKRAIPGIEKVARHIADREYLPKEKKSKMAWIQSFVITPIFYRIIVKDKGFRVSESCINCGKCQDVCSLNNVELSEGIPTWHGNCTHCMACISVCPTEAIDYKNKTKYKNRHYIVD